MNAETQEWAEQVATKKAGTFVAIMEPVIYEATLDGIRLGIQKANSKATENCIECLVECLPSEDELDSRAKKAMADAEAQIAPDKTEKPEKICQVAVEQVSVEEFFDRIRESLRESQDEERKCKTSTNHGMDEW